VKIYSNFKSFNPRGFGNISPRKTSQPNPSNHDQFSGGFNRDIPDKLAIIPLDLEKPSGLPVKDFLPKKFQVYKIYYNI